MSSLAFLEATSPYRPLFCGFPFKFANIKLWCQSIDKLEFEPYSTKVWENFEMFMSEMPINAVNHQKSDSPQAEIWKFKFLPKTLSPQALWKVTSPPDRTLWKILIFPQNFGEKWHYGEVNGSCKKCLQYGFFINLHKWKSHIVSIFYNCHWPHHSVISPQNFGEKSGFSKGFCLGGKSLFKVPGEKGFWEGIWIFRFLPGGSLIFDDLQH
jgi:hypothetical protein